MMGYDVDIRAEVAALEKEEREKLKRQPCEVCGLKHKVGTRQEVISHFTCGRTVMHMCSSCITAFRRNGHEVRPMKREWA